MAFMPQFKGPIEGWVVNHLRKHYWRVSNTHEHEEVMQEAYIVFLRCAARYSSVKEPQHFMALFKSAWINEFNDLSTRATAARVTVAVSSLSDDEEAPALDLVGDLENAGQLLTMIRQAPREVLMVLNLFLNAPQELLELAAATWRASGKYRADGDKAVSRMLGLPEGSQPVTNTRAYFEDSPSPPYSST